MGSSPVRVTKIAFPGVELVNAWESNEHDIAFLERLTNELSTYSKANEEIVAGKIKPHCIRKEIGFVGTLRVEAYYVLTMPDGSLGYFDPYCGIPMVRKFRYE